MIVVGSFARDLLLNGDMDLNRDIDIWVGENETHPESLFGSKRLDVSVMPAKVMELLSGYSLEFHGVSFADLDALLTIKASHLEYDINWKKHSADFINLRRYGLELIPELLDALRAYWKELHGSSKSKLSLYKTKDEFFDDFVPKRFDHDYLHELVAKPNRPVYEGCLKEGQEVLIDRGKFDELDFDQQVRMFKEEVAVIALERWLLNPKCGITIGNAWHRSLHKTVTALTKGWASQFIVDNLLEFVNNPLYSEIKSTLEDLKMAGEFLTHDELNSKVVAGFEAAGLELHDTPYLDEYLYGLDGVVEVVHSESGSYGDAFNVLKIFGDPNLYRVDYYESSYSGVDAYNARIKIVEPKKVMVTVYE